MLPSMLHVNRSLLHVPSPQPSPTPSEGGRRKRQAPSYRHGTPSGPWPWVDIDDQVDKDRIEDPGNHLPMSGAPCAHEVPQGKQQDYCWCKYPQSLFPNWTEKQQKKSSIRGKIKNKRGKCQVWYVDVSNNGRFVSAGLPKQVNNSSAQTLDNQWALMMNERPQGAKARVIFIDKVTGPIMQMMGTRYNIEPFFFSSCINWIPSRFQSNIAPGHTGDHITLTLSFIRGRPLVTDSIGLTASDLPSPAASVFTRDTQATARSRLNRSELEELEIDTHAPLPLRSSKDGILDRCDIELVPDFISLHMVRSLHSSTVISCHHRKETTSAETMYERFMLTGKSVYWSSIFEKTQDATFLLLSILWYVMYAWDEVFESLYSHICVLESEVMEAEHLHLTRELHAIRAHLMHHEALLEDFKKTVEFVKTTPHPALDNEEAVSPELRQTTLSWIDRECDNMIRDIERLERSRKMQDKRLKNVMDLGFSLINIEDSRRMKKLTQAAVRDSAAMKQIAYLTMVFLPATLVAATFGMNIIEVNPEESAVHMTLALYFTIALSLTIITVWIVIALQIQVEDPKKQEKGHKPRQPSWQNEIARMIRARNYVRMGVFSRLLWPVFLIMSILDRKNALEGRGGKQTGRMKCL